MAGVWKKTLTYLGLVEDEELEEAATEPVGESGPVRRLVDFASGLVFGLNGKIELVASRVYLLTPQDIEVSAEERERLREGGFYNFS